MSQKSAISVEKGCFLVQNPRKQGVFHFTDIFKRIFLNVRLSVRLPLKFVPRCPIDSKWARGGGGGGGGGEYQIFTKMTKKEWLNLKIFTNITQREWLKMKEMIPNTGVCLTFEYPTRGCAWGEKGGSKGRYIPTDSECPHPHPHPATSILH